MSIFNWLDWFGEKPRGLGYREDPLDSRDRQVGELLEKLGVAAAEPPKTASVFHTQIRIKDQGSTQSCVGQSVSQAVQIAYLMDSVACRELSALFAYYNARAEESPCPELDTIKDVGAYIRLAIKGLQKLGEAEEWAWPFKEGKVNKRPSWTSYRNASSRRGVRGYYRISTGDVVNQVKLAISQRRPVVGGWRIDEAFCKPEGVGIVKAITRDFVGGHAMLVESYSADGSFTLVNSWGADWREGGRVRVSAEFIESVNDMWAIDV
jgi:hypothetical protein